MASDYLREKTNEEKKKKHVMPFIIPIDRIRTIAPPERDPVAESILTVPFQDNATSEELPFSLDEQDPILQQGLLAHPDQPFPLSPSSPVLQQQPQSPHSSSTNNIDNHNINQRLDSIRTPGRQQHHSTLGFQSPSNHELHLLPDEIPTLQEDEERDLMERLDYEITRAEEVAVLGRLDADILKAEEDDLMQRLLESIEEAERAKWAITPQASLVEQLEMADQQENQDYMEWEKSTWEQVSLSPRLSRNLLTFTESGVSIPTTDIVQDLVEFRFHQATKLIPRRFGSTVLITPQILDREVLGQVKSELRKMLRLARSNQQNQLPSWFEHCFNVELLDVEEDQDSYLMVATGHVKALERLKEELEIWIRGNINVHNLNAILADGASIELDVTCAGKQSLGARLVNWDDDIIAKIKHHGVWLKALVPDGFLASSLGIGAGKLQGMAIIKVNGKECLGSFHLQEMLIEAKRKDGDMTITLCLSKYTDVSNLQQNVSAPRRRDGAPWKPYVAAPRRPRRPISSVLSPVSISPASKSDRQYSLSFSVPPPPHPPLPPPPDLHQTAALCSQLLRDEKSVIIDLVVSRKSVPSQNKRDTRKVPPLAILRIVLKSLRLDTLRPLASSRTAPISEAESPMIRRSCPFCLKLNKKQGPAYESLATSDIDAPNGSRDETTRSIITLFSSLNSCEHKAAV